MSSLVLSVFFSLSLALSKLTLNGETDLAGCFACFDLRGGILLLFFRLEGYEYKLLLLNNGEEILF